MSSMSSQNIPVPKKQGNSMSVSAEGRYEVEKAVSYTHLTLPTICSV